MRRPLAILTAALLTSEFWLLNSGAQGLPTFEDFRRADRERRETGQFQTIDSMTLMRVDPERLARVAAENRRDPELLFGLAELGGDWPAALEANGTNAIVALRFACARAVKRDYDTARRWFRYCQTSDSNNIVPWLGELWVLRQQNELTDAFHPPERATDYRDYAGPAARARVRVLEKAGYTPYAARRITLMQNTLVESMAQSLSRGPVRQPTVPFLLDAARAMQRRPTFLLTELVGQTLERRVLETMSKTNEEAIVKRLDEIDDRREEVKRLVSNTERNVVDLATESEMVQYYDDVLALGEEAAMRRLAAAVRGKLTTP
ncbi:MAG TPA: hypothetical protein VL486_15215 [Verrucomicrobiae bacterium]|nr:hypothetical protein [Verrucomicrobiae bacterium]